MPVSSAGHLPQITSTTYPALVSYLTSTHHAQKVSNWSVSIRIFRSRYESSKDSTTTSSSSSSTSRPKVMYVVSLSEFPTDTFILIEDGEKDTRASVRRRIQEQKQQQQLFSMNENQVGSQVLAVVAAVAPSNSNDNVAQLQNSLQKTSTRYTLFTSSVHYPLLLSRLNLPSALGAPSMGDGVSHSNNVAAAGPGAWLPRGGSILIEGATYEIPSAARYDVEEMPNESNCEWKIRLGMLSSGANRSSGAVVENEYLPLLRLSDPMLLLSHLHSLFPPYLTMPIQEGQGQGVNNSPFVHYPSVEQWDEVIPASNQAWVENLDKIKAEDKCGWRGKERGRRLAYLYITLLRAQGIL